MRITIAAAVLGAAVLGACSSAAPDVRDAIGRQPPSDAVDVAGGKVYIWRGRGCELSVAAGADRRVTAVDGKGDCAALRAKLGL